MTSRSVELLLGLAALTAGSIACARDAAPTPAPAVSSTPTPTTPAVTLLSLAELRASVPELRGWTRSEITEQQAPPPSPGAHVTATFTRGSEKMELEVADTGGAPRAIESLENIAGSTMNRKVGNGYFRGTVVATHPAVEAWNTQDKVGELSVLIRRRFIVHVAGSGLKDAAPMRTLAEAVDTSRLR